MSDLERVMEWALSQVGTPEWVPWERLLANEVLRLRCELADMTSEANAWRANARDSGEEARKYKRELAEARDCCAIKDNRTLQLEAKLAEARDMRSKELAYVIETCRRAIKARDNQEARDQVLDLSAWAESRAKVNPAAITPAAPAPAPR